MQTVEGENGSRGTRAKARALKRLRTTILGVVQRTSSSSTPKPSTVPPGSRNASTDAVR